jgi:hypothetical protein
MPAIIRHNVDGTCAGANVGIENVNMPNHGEVYLDRF